jgi:ADP-heptose:LPS heptosyltransferase
MSKLYPYGYALLKEWLSKEEAKVARLDAKYKRAISNYMGTLSLDLLIGRLHNAEQTVKTLRKVLKLLGE